MTPGGPQSETEFGGLSYSEPEAPAGTNASYIDSVTWWPDICRTPLLPGQRPSNVEIFIPPTLLTAILVAGLVSMVFYDRSKSKRHRHFWDKVVREPHNHNIKNAAIINKMHSVDFSVDDALGDPDIFYDKFDLEVLDDLKTKNNKYSTLLRLCIPSLISLGLASSFMFTQQLVFNCMWPLKSRPDINTAVTCFLAPAGLVYALSFGFTFQQVLEKHRHILNKITLEMSMMDQMVTMTSKMALPSRRHTMAMFKCIKSETIFMGMQIQKRGVESFKNTPSPIIQVHIWQTLDILRDAAEAKESNFNLNRLLVDKMVHYMIQLNSICSDRMGALHSGIHPLKWLFLEVLGTVTLFGVMLIDATSAKMELAMCELTIFSVSMLCYVLSDIDSPFNGFFRVDTSVLPDVVKRLENLYRSAQIEEQLERAMKKTIKYPPVAQTETPDIEGGMQKEPSEDTTDYSIVSETPNNFDANKNKQADDKKLRKELSILNMSNISSSRISISCSTDSNASSARSSAKSVLTKHQ